jgi:hypothetical protein
MATTYVIAYAGQTTPAPNTEIYTSVEEALVFFNANQIYRTDENAADWYNDANKSLISETDGSKYIFLTFIDGVLQTEPIL